MPGYLSAADLGVMFREKDIVNEVAAPIKASEYLCCGLPILTNTLVEFTQDFVERTGFGIVVNETETLTAETVTGLVKEDSERISSYSRTEFGVENVSKQYVQCYLVCLTSNLVYENINSQ